MGAHSASRKERIAAGVRAAWAAGKYEGSKPRGGHRFRSGNKPWNAGLTARTDKRVAAQSARQLGGPPPGRPWKKGDGVARDLRAKQLEHEAAQAEKLAEQGYEVFSPTAVCDRIAIKDGVVYFVEFKKPGQRLRFGQQRVHDTSPEHYLVVYA